MLSLKWGSRVKKPRRPASQWRQLVGTGLTLPHGWAGSDSGKQGGQGGNEYFQQQTSLECQGDFFFLMAGNVIHSIVPMFRLCCDIHSEITGDRQLIIPARNKDSIRTKLKRKEEGYRQHKCSNSAPISLFILRHTLKCIYAQISPDLGACAMHRAQTLRPKGSLGRFVWRERERENIIPLYPKV